MPKKSDPSLPRGIYEHPTKPEIYCIQWFDNAGNRHRETVGKLTAAKKLYGKRKEESRVGKKLDHPLNRKGQTVGDILERYHGEMTMAKKPHAVQVAKKHVEVFKAAFGDWPVDDLKAGDIEAWKAKQLATKADLKPANFEAWKRRQIRLNGSLKPGEVEAWQATRLRAKAPATVNRALSFLKRVFTLAVRDEIVEVNPLSQGRVKMLREDNRRERFLTEAEEAQFTTLPRGFFLAFVLALHTGMRQGEQFSMRRENVDLKRKFVKLPDTKAKEPQMLRLNPVALVALTEIMASHESEWVFPGKPGSKLGHLRGNSVAQRFERACERRKLKDVTWHTLRHTYISRLCMLGVPLPTVQKLARHKSITMTLRYSHLCPAHEEESLENLARAYPSLSKQLPLELPPEIQPD